MHICTASMTENSKTAGLDRRQVLKAFSGVTAGSSMCYVDKVNASYSDHPDYVEVPKVVTDREVKETERVPQKWHEHIKTARENVYEAQDMLRDADGVASLTLSRSTRKYGGKNGVKIKVGADPDMSIGTTVPEQVGDTPLEIEEREGLSPIEPLEVDGERESIEEGQQMNSDEDNPPCYYNDFSERISGGSNVKAIVDKIFIQSTLYDSQG